MNVKLSSPFKFDTRSLALFASLALGSGLAAAQSPFTVGPGPAVAPQASASAPAAAPDVPAAPAGTAFRQLDTDGNGSISRQEATAASGLSNRFDKADADRDGALSQAEFYRAPR